VRRFYLPCKDLNDCPNMMGTGFDDNRKHLIEDAHLQVRFRT